MISYEEDWVFLLLFHRKGSVARRASYFAFPCALLSFLMVLMDNAQPMSVDGHEISRQNFGMTQLTKTQLWTATTAVLVLLLSFRTNRAMTRFWEGTGLLHQMRGEWFDAISCCVTFSHMAMATKQREVMCFRHTLVRLMSLCHGSALEEISGDSAREVSTIDPFGLDTETLCYLNDCKHVYNFNRVEVLVHMTQSIITRSFHDGVLNIPPPILSRVYQTLSRGFVNLLNARKIADTRFPFPFAQLISILLAMHMVATPLLISCLVPNLFWAPAFAFVPMFAMASLNLISIELENPFGDDANDLPLPEFQGEMNASLMMLLHPSSDIIASIAEERCIFEFKDLARLFHGSDYSDGKTCRLTAFQHGPPGVSTSTTEFDKEATNGSMTNVTSVTNSVGVRSAHNSLFEAVKKISYASMAASLAASSSMATASSAKSSATDSPRLKTPKRGRTSSIPEADEVDANCDGPAAAPQAIDAKDEGSAKRNRSIRISVDGNSSLLSEKPSTCLSMPASMAKGGLDDKHIQELHRSLTALKEFTSSLAFVIESLISRSEETLPSPPSKQIALKTTAVKLLKL